MIKSVFKILLFIAVIILDGTLMAVLPFGRYFFISIALLILAVYLGSPLFSKLLWVTALMLGLFSAAPWYLVMGGVLIWGLAVKRILMILFSAKSIFSLLIFYLLSYGLFDGFLIIVHLIKQVNEKAVWAWPELLLELKFASLGLLAGGVATAIIYILVIYFGKKFSSLFFIRRRV